MGADEEDLHPWLVEEKRHTATRPSRSPDHASSTIPLAYGLLGRWLVRVARVPAQAIG